MLKFSLDEEYKKIKEHFILVKWEGKPLDPAWKGDLSCSFCVHPIRKSANEDDDGIQGLCELANRFFEFVSVETAWLFFVYFKKSYDLLSEMKESSIDTYREFKEDLTNLTHTTFIDNLDLFKWVMDFIPTLGLGEPDMRDKGTRVKDSPEKTFGPDQYPLVHGVSLVCKLLVPVIRHSLDIFKYFCGTESRELYTYEVFEGIFTHHKSGFKEIYEKLHFYITSEALKSLKNQKNRNPGRNTNYVFSMTNQGFCKDRFLDYVEAVIMCRKLVSFDFFKTNKSDKKPDIMVYICGGVARTVESKLAAFHKNTQVMALFDVKETSLDDDNTSHIEHGSKISRVPCDVNKTVEVSLENAIPRILFDMEVDEDLFKKGMKFYDSNPINQSVFNIALTSSLLSQYIGGSSMIYRLRSLQFTKLIMIVQLKMVEWGLLNLIPFMSCFGVEEKSSEISPVSMINKNFEKLKEFNEFKRLCPGTSERILTAAEQGRATKSQMIEIVSVTTQVTTIVNWCIDYVHRYNLPPFLLDMLAKEDVQPQNGQVIPLDAHLSRNICRYFVNCHSKGETHL